MADSVTSTAPVKLVILPRTRAGMDRRALRRHLETIHGPMVVAEPEVSGRFASYVHHYARDLRPAEVAGTLSDRDALTIIRFATLADLGASKANAGYRERIGPDEDNFREIEGSVALFAEEQEIAPGVDNAACKLFIFRDALPQCAAEWTQTLGDIVRHNGLPGAITNTAKVVEGHFAYSQFDEIGLPETVDAAGLARTVALAAREHFGAADTKLFLAAPVRFI